MGKSLIEKANAFEREKARKVYDKKVEEKIEEIEKGEADNRWDPDDYSGRTETIDGLEIYLSQTDKDIRSSK